MKKIIICFCFLLSSNPAIAKMHVINDNDSNIDCHNYPMNVATTWLSNNHILNISNIKQISGERISSEKIGRGMRNNVFYFIFEDNEDNKYEVITRNIASREECSISGADIYLISKSSDDKIKDQKYYLKYAD